MNTATDAQYNLCYVDAMSDLFLMIILCYVVGLIAVYFSKSRKKRK